MHKTKYRKTTRARPPAVKSDPRGRKSKFLEKRLSPTAQYGYHQQHKTVITNSTKRLSSTAQNHYADLEDTCRDKVAKVGVTVRYTKYVIKKKQRLGSYLTPGGRLRVNNFVVLEMASKHQNNNKVFGFFVCGGIVI